MPSKTAYSLVKELKEYPWLDIRAGVEACGYEFSSRGDPMDLLVTWTPWKNSLAHRYGEQQKASARDWVVFENGYLPFGKNDEKYYCADLNGFNGFGDHVVDDVDASRFDSLGKSVQGWQKSGDYILVVSQFGHLDTRYSMPVNWPDSIIRQIRNHSDMPIVYRPKPGRNRLPVGRYRGLEIADVGMPMADLIANAWIVVTWNSKAAIEALLAGVPAVVNAPVGIAKEMGTELESINEPYYPEDRISFFRKLACLQWSAAEISDGRPFKEMLK